MHWRTSCLTRRVVLAILNRVPHSFSQYSETALLPDKSLLVKLLLFPVKNLRDDSPLCNIIYRKAFRRIFRAAS